MSKKICAPNKKYKGGTCFSMKSLKNIAKKVNKDSRFDSYKDIKLEKYNKNNKAKLAKEIQKKLNCKKHLDFCVINKKQDFYKELKATFKPRAPKGQYDWLSSIDIRDVMEQYEKKYPEFNFMGPFPIDFAQVYQEMANINIKTLCKKQKKIGIVFNTDTSDGNGEHWISLFIDLKDRTICFFDSVGDKPPREVTALIRKIRKQAKDMKCPLKLVVNKKEFQLKNTECGMYSLFHIIMRLKGHSCSYIYNMDRKKASDEVMNKLRKSYFRPC